MSVQTQIDRISGAVSDALAALTEKGVTVPDGTKVDGLAALIAAIESGGSEIFTGSFTPAGAVTGLPTNEDSCVSYIDTGRTDLPWLYAYWRDGGYAGTYDFLAMIAVKTNDSNYYALATSYNVKSSSSYSGTGYRALDTSALISGRSIFTSSSNVKLFAGETYNWLAIY